jgi:hypothetical protein
VCQKAKPLFSEVEHLELSKAERLSQEHIPKISRGNGSMALNPKRKWLNDFKSLEEMVEVLIKSQEEMVK